MMARRQLPKLIGFAVDLPVELHPETDLWKRGYRTGTIVKVGRKLIHVNVDRLGRVVRLVPGNIHKIIT
jgi:hypothetical protein